MRFLRRQAGQSRAEVPGTLDAAAVASEQPKRPAGTQGKGRPTPKRRDNLSKPRGPAPPPPKTQREAAKLAKQNRGSRQDRRAAAADRRARMMAGDDKALLPRDRGPVKAYVRDIVDSRRHLMGMFMPLAGLVFLSVVVPVRGIQNYLSLVCMVLLIAMVVEGVLLGGQVNRKVRARFPDAKTGLGLGWYVFTRASQIRKLRIPKPRMAYGSNP